MVALINPTVCKRYLKTYRQKGLIRVQDDCGKNEDIFSKLLKMIYEVRIYQQTDNLFITNLLINYLWIKH